MFSGAPKLRCIVLEKVSLSFIYRGWDGYQQSLVSAISSLSAEQLLYRSTPSQRSVGEIASHIAFGRLDWFNRMSTPGTESLVERAAPFWKPWGEVNSEINDNVIEIVNWLELTWEMIETNLSNWSVEDLTWCYRQQYGDKTYEVSRQWVLWRILSHDIHHGGQLSVLLANQGLDLPELGHNGGHIIGLPLVDDFRNY